MRERAREVVCERAAKHVQYCYLAFILDLYYQSRRRSIGASRFTLNGTGTKKGIREQKRCCLRAPCGRDPSCVFQYIIRSAA